MTKTSNGSINNSSRFEYLEQLAAGKIPAEPRGQPLLDRLMNPAVRGPFLEALLQQSWPAIQDMVAGLTAIGDDRDRAAIVLSPLLHSNTEGLVLLAIEALRTLGTPAGRPALAERVHFDKRKQVRQAASNALINLPDQPVPLIKEAALPLHSAHLTIIDGSGDQMAVVARRWDLETVAIFNVIFNDTHGITDSFGSPADPAAELVDILDDLEDDGLTPVAASLHEVRSLIDQAYRQTLTLRGRVAVGFAAWQSFLAGDDPRYIPPVQLPAVDFDADFELFVESNQLLDLDEFGTWYFDEADIEPALNKLHKLQRLRHDRKYESQIVGLIRQTLNTYMTPERQHLFRQRLERQAAYLLRINPEEPLHVRRALAAAAGLRDEAGVAPGEHPFLQEMLIRTFEDHLGRPLTDKRGDAA